MDLIGTADKMSRVDGSINIEEEWNKAFISLDYEGPNKLEFEHRSIHNGQRKLFNSLLLFMTKYHHLSRDVIYIGAFPGFNIAAVAKCFPNHKFHLYDLKEIELNNYPENIIIYEKQYVNENTKFTVPQGQCLLFSDIRTEEFDKERSVEKDQELQLQILQKIKPLAFSLKFRIPFYDSSLKKTDEYTYLAGKLYIQPYAPQQSTEVRLLSQFTTDRVKYNLKTHENKMFYVNKILREWQQFSRVKEGVEGTDKCYDCALEEAICETYLSNCRDYYIGFENDLKLRTGSDVGIVSFRNYIGKLHSTLHITPHNIFKERRLPGEAIKKVDILNVVSKIYHEWIGYEESITQPIIKKWFEGKPFNRTLLIDTFTHSSVKSNNNYEQYEFLGDGILNSETRHYLQKYYYAPRVHDLSTVYNYLASSSFRAENVEPLLNLSKYLDIEHHGLITDKVKDDLIEAFFGMTRILFDRNIAEGYGMTVATKILTKLLECINIEKFKDKVLSKKTILKEYLDKTYPNIGGFAKLYNVKKEADNLITVTISYDNGILVRLVNNKLTQTQLEEEASDTALKRLDQVHPKIVYNRKVTASINPRENFASTCSTCALRHPQQ